MSESDLIGGFLGCVFGLHLIGWLRDTLTARFEAVRGQLDERGLRLLAAAEARAAGYGGIAAVARATGIARSTSGGGLDLDEPALPPGQVVVPAAGASPCRRRIRRSWRICADWSSRQRSAIRCGRCCGSPRATPSFRTHCMRWATRQPEHGRQAAAGGRWRS